MSKTDKDRPYWVQNQESGRIDHDHRTGKCIVGTSKRDDWKSFSSHYRSCKKRIEVIDYCTKQDPHRKPWVGQTCWVTNWVRVDYGIMTIRVQCDGVRRFEHDASIPCSCDDRPPRATCFPTWEYGRYYYGTAPRWFTRATWHKPERARERDLDGMRREYNAYGDIEDDDFENRNHRHSGAWYYW